jgi:hypothetical protein
MHLEDSTTGEFIELTLAAPAPVGREDNRFKMPGAQHAFPN